MSSSVVVVIKPWPKGVRSGGVACEGLGVSPALLHCPVEAFDFPVLPRAVRADEDMFGFQSRQDSSKVVGVRVIPGVITHDFSDGDAMAGIKKGSAF